MYDSKEKLQVRENGIRNFIKSLELESLEINSKDISDRTGSQEKHLKNKPFGTKVKVFLNKYDEKLVLSSTVIGEIEIVKKQTRLMTETR